MSTTPRPGEGFNLEGRKAHYPLIPTGQAERVHHGISTAEPFRLSGESELVERSCYNGQCTLLTVFLTMTSSSSTYYHVTERENMISILKEGFFGGWGDVGFGVYLYDNVVSAQEYAHKGGWDHNLTDPVILAIQGDDIMKVVPNSEWPPEKYSAMFWKELDEDREDIPWKPLRVDVVELRVPRKINP